MLHLCRDKILILILILMLGSDAFAVQPSFIFRGLGGTMSDRFPRDSFDDGTYYYSPGGWGSEGPESDWWYNRFFQDSCEIKDYAEIIEFSLGVCQGIVPGGEIRCKGKKTLTDCVNQWQLMIMIEEKYQEYLSASDAEKVVIKNDESNYRPHTTVRWPTTDNPKCPLSSACCAEGFKEYCDTTPWIEPGTDAAHIVLHGFCGIGCAALIGWALVGGKWKK
jgi:hypothetical protein